MAFQSRTIVKAALKQLGPEHETRNIGLYRAPEGYFYLLEDCGIMEADSFYVNRLNDVPFEMWVGWVVTEISNHDAKIEEREERSREKGA